jgi:hypothetical protein
MASAGTGSAAVWRLMSRINICVEALRTILGVVEPRPTKWPAPYFSIKSTIEAALVCIELT